MLPQCSVTFTAASDMLRDKPIIIMRFMNSLHHPFGIGLLFAIVLVACFLVYLCVYLMCSSAFHRVTSYVVYFLFFSLFFCFFFTLLWLVSNI